MGIEVTIGVCVKNSEKIVTTALESVDRQNFPHEQIELIMVDDGSTDNTLGVLRRFIPRTRIRARICCSDGKGLGYARQMVVDKAEGRYMVWVDGDMEAQGGFVRKHVQFMESNPNVGVACGTEIAREQGKLVSVLESLSCLGKDGLLDLGGGIFRLEAVRQAGGFDTRIKGAGEDLELIHRITKSGWALSRSPAEYYHNHRETWKALWDEYFWWGYGMHYAAHKHRDLMSGARALWKKAPLIALIDGLRRSASAYKIVYKKKAFFLAPHFVFRNMGWCLGFLASHINGYGHDGSESSQYVDKTPSQDGIQVTANSLAVLSYKKQSSIPYRT